MSLIEVDFVRECHPVDVIEQVAQSHDWPFDRPVDDEIGISVIGHWTEYQVSFSWMPDFEALHVACTFDQKVPGLRNAEISRLLTLINEQLLVGHFDLWSSEGIIMFRQTLMLPGGLEPTELQVETLLNAALESCEGYFQAFQFVAWAGQTAEQAMQSAMFETFGTA